MRAAEEQRLRLIVRMLNMVRKKKGIELIDANKEYWEYEKKLISEAKGGGKDGI